MFLSSWLAVLLFGAIQSARAIDTTNSRWVNTWTTMPQLTEPANLPPPPYNPTALEWDHKYAAHVHWRRGDPRALFQRVWREQSHHLRRDDAHVQREPQYFRAQWRAYRLRPHSVPNQGAADDHGRIQHYLASGQPRHDVDVFWQCCSRGEYYRPLDNQCAALVNTRPLRLSDVYFVSAVETFTTRSASAFVIVGDSLTDGRESDTDKNNRWPDLLLARMQKSAATALISVNNQAAGGNRILADGLGPNALGRIDRDVLAQTGVKYVMIFEGVNDIGVAAAERGAQAAIGDAVIAAFKQIATRVHAAGLPFFAATITPFGAPANDSAIQPYSSPVREVTRQRVNAFIRTSGVFDAVVDFDRVVADPKIPSQLAPQFDSGDFLHPNVAGYTAMAAAFPLGLFGEFAEGVGRFQ
ncbi:SGNH hydrolase [Mycena pura]|uniref:SGNH hydrolase n=1 Tax=Mycena pura TaxID=153505 RepID=A0AAD6VFH6_9AGAR|nr:SGNH hydrolase [Mycena pura]